jgi:hypothetical protein
MTMKRRDFLEFPVAAAAYAMVARGAGGKADAGRAGAGGKVFT